MTDQDIKAIIASAETKMTKAKARLILHHPFFASILLQRPLRYTQAIPIAGVDARANIYINPVVVDKLSIDQLVFALGHEIMHVVLLHAQREGSREHMKWNYACDAPINAILKDCGLGEPIAGIVDMPETIDKTAEEVYNTLPDNPAGGGDGQGGAPGGMGSDLIPGDGSNSDDPTKAKGMTEAEMAAVEAEIKVTIAQAAQAARMQGKLPANLARIVDEVLSVKTPWYELLERFMMQRTNSDYSWHRPNRRFVAQGTYLPSLNDTAAMGKLAVVVDTSGSISDHELAYFAGHINAIMERCVPETVHIVYCDAAVSKTVEVMGTDLPLKLEAVGGGGGTDMRIGLQWVDDHVPDAACCVLLTDGYTPWPEDTDVPLMVLCTTNAEVPVGEAVRFSMED